LSCDEIKERLSDHLLGEADPEVAHHLRGCAPCRAELAALDEGMTALTFAAPEFEPPTELREHVLSAIEQEWSEPAHEPVALERHPAARRRPTAWLAVAAAVVILAGSLGWGISQSKRANTNAVAAASYTRFLSTLGGKNVREGKLVPSGSQAFEGSAVIYDSMENQSWVLMLGRAPSYKGQANVTLSSPTGNMSLPPLEFQPSGDAYSVFVTPKDLSSYNRVTISEPNGAVIASGTIGN
jgi:hypothetical protein